MAGTLCTTAPAGLGGGVPAAPRPQRPAPAERGARSLFSQAPEKASRVALPLPLGNLPLATALGAGAGSPSRDLPFPREGHSRTPRHLRATRSPLGAQRTPAAACCLQAAATRLPESLPVAAAAASGTREAAGAGLGGTPGGAAAAPAPPAAPGAPTRRGGAAGWPGARAAREARPGARLGEGLEAEAAGRETPAEGPAPGRRGGAAPAWSGRALAPRGRGTATLWKRGWTTTGTSPSLTLLGKPPGKRRTRADPAGRGARPGCCLVAPSPSAP